MAVAQKKAKYHLAKDGSAQPCHAVKRGCPLTDENGERPPHAIFNSPEEAQRWAEDVNAEKARMEGNPALASRMRSDAEGIARRVRRRITAQEKRLVSETARQTKDFIRKRGLIGQVHVDKAKNDLAVQRLLKAVDTSDARHNEHQITALRNSIMADSQKHQLANGRSVSTTAYLQADADVQRYEQNREKVMALASAYAASHNLPKGHKHEIKTETAIVRITVGEKLDKDALAEHPRFSEFSKEEAYYDVEEIREAMGEEAYLAASTPADRLNVIVGDPISTSTPKVSVKKDADFAEITAAMDRNVRQIQAQYGSVSNLKTREALAKDAIKNTAAQYRSYGRPVYMASSRENNAVLHVPAARFSAKKFEELYPDDAAKFKKLRTVVDEKKVTEVLSKNELESFTNKTASIYVKDRV